MNLYYKEPLGSASAPESISFSLRASATESITKTHKNPYKNPGIAGLRWFTKSELEKHPLAPIWFFIMAIQCGLQDVYFFYKAD
jgi:hypothetical protein